MGIATLYRVLQGNRSWFGIAMASSVILWISLTYGEELCTSFWRVQCNGFYGGGNLRWQYLLLALANIADAHMIIFALNYLDEGIQYSNVYTNERGRKIWLAVVILLYAVYFSACFGVFIYLFFTQPVFRPSPDAGIE